jgi:hypothetical protein
MFNNIMQIKNKQIVLTVGQSRKVVDIIVSITVPFKGIATCCLNRLKANCSGDNELMAGAEEAALAYALFETIRDKLSGSSLEILKNRCTSIKCYTVNGNLVISYYTAGTGSALRKSCGIVLSSLNPIKLFSKYSENIKFLSGKGGNRGEFNFVAKKLAEGIKKDIHITAIGKITTDATKLKDIVGVLVNKLAQIDIAPAKEITSIGKHVSVVKENPYPIVKCTGLDASLVSDYIRNNSNGMAVSIVPEGVVVYNHSWESKRNQLKDTKRIKDYVTKKYEKLEDKDELSILFAYFSLSEGYIDSLIASKLVSTKLKSSSIIDILKKSL